MNGSVVRLCVLLVVLAVETPAVMAGYDSTYDALTRQLSQGSEDEIAAILQNDCRFQEILSRIENGDDSLIRLAPRLRAHLDGANALGLEFALSRALRLSPEAVLSLIPAIPLDRLCTVPWIEAPPDIERRWRLSVRPVLLDVSDPALRGRRDACLMRIGAPERPTTP